MKLRFHFYVLFSAASLGLFALAGCSTTPKNTKTAEYFFPPPPDAPRLQFLTGFMSEKTFRGGEEKNMMTFLTGAKAPEKELGKPYGIAVGNQKIYICDTAIQAVLVVDLQTRRIGVIQAEGQGALKNPLNVSTDEEGNCYVADTGRNQIVVFDKNANFLYAIGKEGELKPRDVVVRKDRIYVADLQTHNVHVYDKQSRNKLLDIPRSQESTNRTRGLFTPTNLALDSKGRVYVSDSGAFRIQVYDSEGNYVRSIGEMGDSLGQFARVKGIAVDRADRLYAVDAMSQAVQIFDPEGKLLTWFADPGDSRTPILPTKVAVDYDNVAAFAKFASPSFEIEHLVFVVNQIGAHKVAVYGFGHKK